MKNYISSNSNLKLAAASSRIKFESPLLPLKEGASYAYHCHVAAPGATVFRCHIVCAAQHQLRIRIAYQLRPQVVWVSVLDLGQVLAAHHHLKRPGTDGTQPPGKVGDDPDIVHLVQHDIYRNRTPLVWRAVCVANQFDN